MCSLHKMEEDSEQATNTASPPQFDLWPMTRSLSKRLKEISTLGKYTDVEVSKVCQNMQITKRFYDVNFSIHIFANTNNKSSIFQTMADIAAMCRPCGVLACHVACGFKTFPDKRVENSPTIEANSIRWGRLQQTNLWPKGNRGEHRGRPRPCWTPTGWLCLQALQPRVTGTVGSKLWQTRWSWKGEGWPHQRSEEGRKIQFLGRQRIAWTNNNLYSQQGDDGIHLWHCKSQQDKWENPVQWRKPKGKWPFWSWYFSLTRTCFSATNVKTMSPPFTTMQLFGNTTWDATPSELSCGGRSNRYWWNKNDDLLYYYI